MKLAPFTKRSIIRASQNQVSCDMAGEAAILNQDSGMYYGLNAVGSRIWSLIQRPTTVNDLLQVLVEEYDVEPSRCERDLLLVLEQLAERGLIEISDKSK